MHRFLSLLVSLAFLSAANTSAQEVCWIDTGQIPRGGEAERLFILAGTSTQRNAWSEKAAYRHPANPEPDLKSVLQTIGLEDLLPENMGRRGLDCDTPYQGEILIRQVRALGPDHPYIRRLAETQLLALANCSLRRGEDARLPEPNWGDIFTAEKDLRQAEDDFAYLTGAAYFHAHKYAKAREVFALVGRDALSPHRQAGRLMEVRSLRASGAADKAYALAKRYRIEADETRWKIALDEQEDIIAQYSRQADYSADHLDKIFRRASGLPIENEPLGFRVRQATEDFDLYFMNEFARLKAADVAGLPHDWWLRDPPPEGRRAFLAVHALAKRYDGIDWVQAYHASVAFDRDATWFAGPDLNTDDPAYARVSEHAYKKWKDGSARWGMIVAKRMTPGSDHISEIAAYAEKLQTQAASCSLTATEYVIYVRITHHLVRVLATRGNYDEAIDAWSRLYRNQLYPSAEDSVHTQEALSKLFLMRGEYSRIGQIEKIRSDLDRNRTGIFRGPASSRLWTIRSTDELIGPYPDHYISMLNAASEKSILAALDPGPGKPRLQYDKAAKAAEVLWMRGFVFGDEARMARAEPLFLRTHPELKRYFRQANAAVTPEARDFALAVMVLRHPGLTPYADEVRKQRGLSIAELDRGNPIEGNWWCSAADRAHLPGYEARLKEAFFDYAMKAVPPPRGQERDRVRQPGYSPTTENHQIDQAWQRFRQVYGPFDALSEAEEHRLTGVPRASEWLAAKVRAYIESPAGIADRKRPRDERIPESLHRLVMATRYSCHTLPRGNAETSRWAFTQLHAHYEETPWAAETPYWFDKIDR